MEIIGMTRKMLSVGEGMDFWVTSRFGALVITAAHCLPFLPPAASIANGSERIYPRLLARYGETPGVAADCIFVDAAADIAVLAAPDAQEDDTVEQAFTNLINALVPFRASAPPENNASPYKGVASLISLDCKPVSCVVEHMGGAALAQEREDP